jgi:hypothetical protein
VQRMLLSDDVRVMQGEGPIKSAGVVDHRNCRPPPIRYNVFRERFRDRIWPNIRKINKASAHFTFTCNLLLRKKSGLVLIERDVMNRLLVSITTGHQNSHDVLENLKNLHFDPKKIEKKSLP